MLAWCAAVAFTVAWCLAFPYRLTDGDSCLYAALARDMAGGGWRAWVAPQWDVAGAWACFHDHPPGALWLAAVLGRLGIAPDRAPLVANALWQVAMLGGVVAVARRFLPASTAALAGVVLALHVPVLKYVQRFALEYPLAATATWAVAAALRLGRSRVWVAVLAASLAGAFLVRGVFGLVPLVLLAVVVAEPALRPPPVRLLAAVLLAAVPAVAFDLAHASATGHGFWVAYVERQVLPSLEPGATRHSLDAHPWGHFMLRLVLYTLPWALLPLGRVLLARGRPLPAPPAWRLALLWIAVTWLGACATTRPASRYLFLAWPASALLAALALGPELPRWLARTAAILFVAAVPVSVVVNSLTSPHDAWWRSADAIAAWRASGGDGAVPVEGPFGPAEDRAKSFLRFHLDAPVHAERAGSPAGRRWHRAGTPPPAGTRLLLVTPIGSLAEGGHDAR